MSRYPALFIYNPVTGVYPAGVGESVAECFKYKAFISYSHSDEKWASWLHKALETYRVPKHLVGDETAFGPVPERLTPVFRDREELSTATSLGDTLTQALKDSACQIVICSPRAAKSHWTNEEILTFKRLGRSDRIFCLIVDGEPGASQDPTTADEECFPPALIYEMGEDGELTDVRSEPIAADARPGKDPKPAAKLKLISGMLGVGYDDLKQREQQRRHRRLMVLTAAAFTGMAVTSGLAITAYFARVEAEEQRNRAQIEAETARQTAQFMVDLFKVSDPSEALGNTITAREILDKGAERIGTELADQPDVQATLMSTMGQVYTGLGLYPPATALLEESLATRRRHKVGSPVQMADTMDSLAEVLALSADYDEAYELVEESLALREQDDGLSGSEGRLQRARTLTAMADILVRKGEYGAAEPLIVESLETRRGVLGEAHADIAENLEDLGLNAYYRGEHEQAIEHLQAALDMRRSLHDGPYPATSEAMSSLALVHLELGDYPAAEALYTEALEMDRILLGEKHPELSTSINNLALVYHDQGDLDTAEKLYRQVLDMDRDMLGQNHPQTATAIINLAFLYLDRGELEGAIALQQQATEILDGVYGEPHPDLAAALSALGFMYNEAGDYASAEPYLTRALDMRRSLLGDDSPDVGKSLLTLATLHLDTQRFAEAEAEANQAHGIFVSSFGEDHWLTGAALSVFGAAQAGQEEFASAEQSLLAAYGTLKKNGNVMPVFLEATMDRLAKLYSEIGQPERAAEYLARASD